MKIILWVMAVTLFAVADEFHFQEYKYNEEGYQSQAPCIKKKNKSQLLNIERTSTEKQGIQ